MGGAEPLAGTRTSPCGSRPHLSFLCEVVSTQGRSTSLKYLALLFHLEALFISETAVTKLQASGMFSVPSGGGQNEDSLQKGIIFAFKVYFFSNISTDLRGNHNVALPALFAYPGEPEHWLQDCTG